MFWFLIETFLKFEFYLKFMKLNTVLEKNPKTIFKSFRNEVVIVNAKKRELLTLDGVSKFIWDNIDGKKTISDIIKLGVKKYGVKKEKFLNDFASLVKGLKGKNLLR